MKTRRDSKAYDTVMDPIRSAPVTIVLPSASREDVAAWATYLAQCPAGSQILAVVDAPLTEVPPQVRVVQHTQPLGIGGCLQTAIWLLETPLVLLVGGGECRPRHAKAMFEEIDNVDLVAACRDIGPPPPPVMIWDLTRMLMARIFLGYFPEPRIGWPGWGDWPRRWTARRLFGVPLHDPCGGLILARSELIRRMPIQSRGSFAWVEIAAKANHLGKLMCEVKAEREPERSPLPPDPFASDAWRLFHQPDFGTCPTH